MNFFVENSFHKFLPLDSYVNPNKKWKAFLISEDDWNSANNNKELKKEREKNVKVSQFLSVWGFVTQPNKTDKWLQNCQM